MEPAPPQRLLRLLQDVHSVQLPNLKRASLGSAARAQYGSSGEASSSSSPSAAAAVMPLDDVEAELTSTLLDIDRTMEAFKLEAFDLGDTEAERRQWAEVVTRASQDVAR